MRRSIVARFPGTRLGDFVEVKSPDRLRLGAGVVIQRGAILHCGGMDWCEGEGGIELGDRVVVGPNCVLYGSAQISVGAYTHLGPGVKVMSQAGDVEKRVEMGGSDLADEPGLVFEPVTVGRGCWLGTGSVLLGGSVLGDGCIVGPNAVVKGRYPDHSSLIGNPARPSLSLSKRARAAATTNREQ